MHALPADFNNIDASGLLHVSLRRVAATPDVGSAVTVFENAEQLAYQGIVLLGDATSVVVSLNRDVSLTSSWPILSGSC